mmetsp:Transcript_108068/g.304426  ORF Transcript_108068/g.304426 Transcript_108068/m.304426 type:complete len:289 (+) Transcript_108068:135-1001(+)
MARASGYRPSAPSILNARFPRHCLDPPDPPRRCFRHHDPPSAFRLPPCRSVSTLPTHPGFNAPLGRLGKDRLYGSMASHSRRQGLQSTLGSSLSLPSLSHSALQSKTGASFSASESTVASNMDAQALGIDLSGTDFSDTSSESPPSEFWDTFQLAPLERSQTLAEGDPFASTIRSLSTGHVPCTLSSSFSLAPMRSSLASTASPWAPSASLEAPRPTACPPTPKTPGPSSRYVPSSPQPPVGYRHSALSSAQLLVPDPPVPRPFDPPSTSPRCGDGVYRRTRAKLTPW